MKAASYTGTEQAARSIPLGQKNSSTQALEQALLSEIGQLGGKERRLGAEGALKAFHTTLADLVRDNPKAYGATDDPTSQTRAVSKLLESVRKPFLSRTVEDLRRQAGYVKFLGHWVHRAVFTFIAFGVLVAAVFPVCAVSVMSASEWGWLPGVLGIAVALALGGLILSRIRNR